MDEMDLHRDCERLMRTPRARRAVDEVQARLWGLPPHEDSSQPHGCLVLALQCMLCIRLRHE